MYNKYHQLFDEAAYLAEFSDFIRTVEFTDRNPLNTEMFFLWCMIRSLQPELFIESGTFRGYSASIICEALKRNNDGAEFVTYGYNLDNCLPYARQRLAGYPFARVIESDSRVELKKWKNERRKTAFFVDGPKGRNMPPLFYTLMRNFHNIQFLAIHDCEQENGSQNRWYIERFFGFEYPIMYCDAAFQEQYAALDKPLIGRSDLAAWQPYQMYGQPRHSYGTETGYILPMLGKHGNLLTHAPHALYRLARFRIYPQIAECIRRGKTVT